MSDTHTVTVIPPAGALLGTLSATVTDTVAYDGQGAVSWTYTLHDAAAQSLGVGDTRTECYVVTIIDDGDRCYAKCDDYHQRHQRCADGGGGDVTGGVTELVTPVGNLTDSGTIAFTDVDLTDIHSVSAVTPSAGALGTLTASVTTGTTTAALAAW